MPYSQFTIKALIYFNQRKIESQKNMFKKAKNSRCIINLQNLRDCGEEPLLTENEDSEAIPSCFNVSPSSLIGITVNDPTFLSIIDNDNVIEQLKYSPKPGFSSS